MKVAGPAFLDQGFTAVGAVSINAAGIDGFVKLGGAELGEPFALRAAGVNVSQQLQWAPRSPVRGLVDLERESASARR